MDITDQDGADRSELAASLAGLQGMLSQKQGLEDTLIKVAFFAVRAIPGADGAGLTLLETGRHQTVVATANFVQEVDEIQYSLGEGPCVSAVAEAQVFSSGNLGGETRWPRFGPRVGRLGVHSALSLPLLLPTGVTGALNVYAHDRDAFGELALRVGAAFAQPAAVSVHNAQTLAEAERVVTQLQQALLSRAQIDQAMGIIMADTGVSADEAFTRLRAISQGRSVKLSLIALEVLAEAADRDRS